MSRKPSLATKSIKVVESAKVPQKTIADLLDPFEKQEYIPVHVIHDLLSLAFPASSIIHSYSATHHILKVSIRTLVHAPLSRWEYNRPADLSRCEDIARYTASSKKPADTMIYLSYNKKTQTFDILDGLHRYTALCIIQKKTEHLDFISENEFSGDMSWLFDSALLLNVRLNAAEGELIELFRTLNKSHPVPDLYIRDVAKDKRLWIDTVVGRWQSQYKVHFSGSNKPNRPNTNREQFVELLDKLYDKLHLTEETKEKLEQALNRGNAHISQNIPKKTTQTIKDKCEASGCWLFIYTGEELLRML